MNRRFHAGIHRGCATKISTSLGRDGLGKVAGTTAAVHCLSLGRKPKTLLRAFVRFDLTFAFSLTHQSRPNGISINLYLWCIYAREENSGADRPWEVLMISMLGVLLYRWPDFPSQCAVGPILRIPCWQPNGKSAIRIVCVRKTSAVGRFWTDVRLRWMDEP